MAFTPVRYDEGKSTEVKMVASQTVAKYDALVEDGNGYYSRATSAATEVRYVALEAKVDDGTNEKLLVLPTDDVEFIADCNTTPVQTDVGTKADLTDHDTLDESTSATDVFFIEEIVSAADKKVRGYFVMKTT